MLKPVAVAIALAPALLGATLQAADATKFFGSWGVDVSKLPVPEPPASVTITWSSAGFGKVKMDVDIEDRRGVKSHAESTFAFDGQATRAEGSLDVDIVSMTMPSDHVLIMGAGMRGKPSNTRIFVVSEDGQRMSETIISHGPGNVPISRVNNWTRK